MEVYPEIKISYPGGKKCGMVLQIGDALGVQLERYNIAGTNDRGAVKIHATFYAHERRIHIEPPED